MCGIAGIITRQPSTNTEDYKSLLKQQLQSMDDSLQHRGPDGEGMWINDNATAGLGHRRLSIIDLSMAGHQPMHYATKGESTTQYTIIHNGEVYNYLELKEELSKLGYTFHSQTDTEVIAAAYDHWKDLCVDHFDGMFSFAIWDENKKELFAARDRFGEKPFFYYRDKNRLLFASEMKALWAIGVERIPNQKMLFNFITIGYTDNPNQPEETFFENINKLPAATCLKYYLANNELILEKYWDIDPENESKKITDSEALEQFNHLFSTSIKRRLRSDVSIGTSLSGGLDSSSIIAAVSSFNSSSSLTAYTAVFPGFENDEAAHAKMVTEKFNLQQYTTAISADDLLEDWQKFCYHQEVPFGSASVYAQYKVYELAKQHGTKVLLDGQGADETLAGYRKYYKWYWQELFRKRKLKKSKEIKAARELGVTENFDFKNIIASYFPDFATIVLENRFLLNAIKHEDFTKEFIKLQSKEAYYAVPERFTLNNALYFNTCTHGLEELLKYADRNSMAHGREVRLPFLSYELVEFIFSLPAHFKVRNGWTKWILRETMKNELPESITWRKDKVGFEPPQKNWMSNKNVQIAIQEAKSTLVNEKVLNPSVLDKKIEPKNSYDADNYDWRYLSAAAIFK